MSRREYIVNLDQLGVYPFQGGEVELKVYATLSVNKELLAETLVPSGLLNPAWHRPALRSPALRPAGALAERRSTWAKLKRVEISAEARRARTLRVSELFMGTASEPLSSIRLQIVVRNVEKTVVEVAGMSTRNFREKHHSFRDAIVYETLIKNVDAGEPIEKGLNEALTFETLFSNHYPPTAVVYEARPRVCCGGGSRA